MTEYNEAMRMSYANRSRRRYPDRNDARTRHGMIFPEFKPKFRISFNAATTVFTLGSCFARNVEEVLAQHDVRLPTMDFAAPKNEWPARPNGLLNEYNPGAMMQRMLFALSGESYPAETIVPTKDKFADLMLPGGAPVTYERALERRQEIDAVYRSLPSSDLLVLTLGLTEAWFDNETQLYLNQMPPADFAAKHAGRFDFRRLDVFGCVPLLERAFNALNRSGQKVLLTVSPVPLYSTFVNNDAVVANEFSKSALRVTADRLSQRPNVDYFPSYEIVRSGGLAVYDEDNIHVRYDVVKRVTDYLVQCYLQPASPAPAATAGSAGTEAATSG